MSGTAGRRVPRALHPLAWWAWAIGLAVASTRTTNPLLLGLLLAVLGVVVVSRRGDTPWARAWRYYLLLAGIVVAVRVVLRAVFGGDVTTAGETVLVRLPRIPLPHWAAGVQVGGPVTGQELLSAFYGGLMLGVLLCCVGAANALANPKRALRILPRALYELGAAVVVAVSVAPQLVESVQRTRRAQRLRGNDASGLRSFLVVAVPVLEDALDRSLQLAAAMDSRGYGRRAGSSPGAARVTTGCLLAGTAGMGLGGYGLLATSEPLWVTGAAFAAGMSGWAAGLLLGGRRVRRSTYRPDPWRWPEWLVGASGLAAAAAFLTGPVTGLDPSTAPVVWPALPALPTLGALVAVVPALLAPPPPRPVPAAVPGTAPRAAAGVEA